MMKDFLMKGKKTDNSFVSEFISDSCSEGKLTTKEIVARAHDQIAEIDKKIIEVEQLKKLRSKLTDVISTFDRNKHCGPQIDESLIKFYSVKDKKMAMKICNEVFSYNNMNEIRKAFPHEPEIYCVKQLLEFNILQRHDQKIKAGENFPAFKIFLKDNYEINR